MKKYIDLFNMANVNCASILNIIQKNGAVSRKEITELSGLSWGGMTKIVTKLLENGYITEEKLEQKKASGRTPHILSVNTQKNFVVGLDVNKMGLKAVVMDLAGNILKSFKEEVTSSERDAFLSEIILFTKKIFESFEENKIVSIGIAMQGIVDFKKGISVKFPDISGWKDVPIKEILENEFHVSVFLEHDPDCLLYPYIQHDKKENTVLLRIDKSIGMAAVIDGKIIKGKGIFEIAHNIVIPDGKVCHCGQKGCIEAYIRDCMKNGEVDAQSVDELLKPLAITVKNISGIFNAERVILTGELMEHRELFCDKLNNELKNLDCDVEIQFAKMSDMSVKGAALIAINLSINSLLI